MPNDLVGRSTKLIELTERFSAFLLRRNQSKDENIKALFFYEARSTWITKVNLGKVRIELKLHNIFPKPALISGRLSKRILPVSTDIPACRYQLITARCASGREKKKKKKVFNGSLIPFAAG
jgi:hypothetical protein